MTDRNQVDRLRAYASLREELLSKVVRALMRDDYVVAAWLSGSFGRGEGDGWADYDLHVVIKDEGLRTFLLGRGDLYRVLGDVVLLQDDIPGQGPVGDQFNLVLFATPFGPIEVDWSFIPYSKALKPVACQVLFEKSPIPVMDVPSLSSNERASEASRWSTFFWAMAPIAVKYCARGETHRAVPQIGLLSRALTCLWRLLDEPAPLRPWQPDSNRPLEAEMDSRLPRLGSSITPESALSVIVALCDRAASLQDRLQPLSAAASTEVILQTNALVITARHEIAAGTFKQRKYR